MPEEGARAEQGAAGPSPRSRQAQSSRSRLIAAQDRDARGATALKFDPRASGWAGAAQRLTVDYLGSISAPNSETLSSAPRFYGDRVRFHGRSMTTAALIAEKRRFVRRWPQRRYTPQEGGMRTVCDAAAETCLVRATLGFRAENPVRNARSQGVSELVLTVSFAGGRPVIVSESSRVLRRFSAASEVVSRLDRGA